MTPVLLALWLAAAPRVPESPRIARLEADLAAGHADAEAGFWREIERDGAPLVESNPRNPKEPLVTFVWRGDAATESVAVFHRSNASRAPADRALQRAGTSQVWYRTYRTLPNARFSYQFMINSDLPPRGKAPARPLDFRLDPLNPKRIPQDASAGAFTASVVEMPAAPPQPFVARREGVPAGRVEHFQLPSKVLGAVRDVSVYLPPNAGTEPMPVVVLSDRQAYLSLVPTPVILDNLIAEKKIPPLVAVLTGQPDQATRTAELPCNRKFTEFLATELLPWARERFPVTSDPARTVVAGASFGGLASTCAAMWHPEVFGNVLSQSGSYWWKPENAAEEEYVLASFRKLKKLPVRFYLDVGLYEGGYQEGVGPGMRDTNQHLRDLLKKKGYPLLYQEFPGGHDYLHWRGTLADGLIFLVGVR